MVLNIGGTFWEKVVFSRKIVIFKHFEGFSGISLIGTAYTYNAQGTQPSSRVAGGRAGGRRARFRARTDALSGPEHRGDRLGKFHFDQKSIIFDDFRDPAPVGVDGTGEHQMALICLRRPPHGPIWCRSTGRTSGGLAQCCLMTVATRRGVRGRPGGPWAAPSLKWIFLQFL